MANWSLTDIPDLSGKHAIVTGGNVGLGFRSVLELARNKASVTIACRKPDAGAKAIARIRDLIPKADLSVIPLDLTDLDSVREFCVRANAQFGQLDILLNNAGVVNLEHLCRTKDGHEMHMATNHYGHFALTAGLFDLLCKTAGSRVVTVSSLGYRSGEIRLDDMDWRQRSYSRQRSYGDSKLANLLFTHALQARFDRAGATSLSVAAHPGLTGTERQQSIGIGGLLARWIASPVETGVAPQLRAATDPGAKKRDFFGPRFGLRGAARVISTPSVAQDDGIAEKLWSFTEQATGVKFD